MDEYLDEEVEVSKVTFDQICKAWERKVLTFVHVSAVFADPA